MTKACERCGVTYTPSRGNRQRYCSVVCASRANTTKGTESLAARQGCVCRTCGATFTRQRNAKGWYCSYVCRPPLPPYKRLIDWPRRLAGLRALRRRYRVSQGDYAVAMGIAHVAAGGDIVREVLPHDIVCKDCGRTFMGKWRQYCGDCAQKREQDQRRKRRRARRLLAAQKPYRDEDIFERDGFRCHFRMTGQCVMPRAKCDATADRMLDDAAPTVDHLVPLSAGGADTPENVATAHRKCNWWHRQFGVSQLRLVG